MKYADINEKFTKTVMEYVKNGYMINTGSMNGTQGEIAKVDLTNGTDIVRVMLDEGFDEKSFKEYKVLIVGRIDGKGIANVPKRNTIWNGDLEIISEERFYEATFNRKDKFYLNYEEEKRAEETRIKRWERNSADKKMKSSVKEFKVDGTLKEKMRNFIRNNFNVKRISDKYIVVGKKDGKYFIQYKKYSTNFQ